MFSLYNKRAVVNSPMSHAFDGMCFTYLLKFILRFYCGRANDYGILECAMKRHCYRMRSLDCESEGWLRANRSYRGRKHCYTRFCPDMCLGYRRLQLNSLLLFPEYMRV